MTAGIIGLRIQLHQLLFYALSATELLPTMKTPLTIWDVSHGCVVCGAAYVLIQNGVYLVP